MENRSHRPSLPSDRYAVTADGSRGNLSGRIIAIGSVLFLPKGLESLVPKLGALFGRKSSLPVVPATQEATHER